MDSLAPSFLVLGLFLLVVPLLPLKRTWARALVVLICAWFSVRYLTWRWIETLPSGLSSLDQLWVWSIFAIECAAYASLAVLLTVMTRRANRSGEANRHETRLRGMPPNQLPSVDVLIPTYNEDLEVLRRTIIGAKNIDYPNFTVYVLDDGRRGWLREYCEEQGVQYVARPDNKHAKAGNLNHGLAQASGEFFAVLDADFVPLRNFLYRTIGFFEDPRIGVVQTPQYFFNPDPIQCNLGLRNDWVDEQRLTFEDIQPCRDAWDCAYCCGSSSVLRRSAVDEAGGIPTESVTEDVLTTLVLLRKGYVTRYLNEKLTHGLAPESVEAFFVQRSRWCRGGLQMMFLEKGPFGRGLTLSQRFFFGTVGFDWMIQCLIRIMVILIPLLAIFFGWKPYESVSTQTFLFYLLPVWLSLKGICFTLAPGRHFPFLNTATWLLICMRILPTVIATLVRPFGAPFRVTPKGSANRNRSDTAVLWTSLILIAVFLAALFLNCYPQFRPVHSGLAGVAGLFCIYNIVLLVLVFFMALEQPRRRVEEWFEAGESCHLIVGSERLPATLAGVSLTGAVLQLDRRVPKHLPVRLEMPGVGRLNTVPTRHGRRSIVVDFQDLEPVTRDRLIRKLYTGSYDNTVRRGNLIGIIGRLSVRFLTGISLRSGHGWETPRNEREERFDGSPMVDPQLPTPRPLAVEMPGSSVDVDAWPQPSN